MEYKNINNEDSGRSVREKINTMFRSLIEGSKGVYSIWDKIISLLDVVKELGDKVSVNYDTLQNNVAHSYEYIDRKVDSIETTLLRHKGYFPSLSSLANAFPFSEEGCIAYVGMRYPYNIYRWEAGSWVDTGTVGGEENVDLTLYYTQDEVNSKIAALNNILETCKVTKIVWDVTSNMDNINQTGVYYISGVRSNTEDNMPIENKGDIIAWLRVANADEQHSFLTQILEIGNKGGSDIKVYTRRYNGSSWSTWTLLQPMVEVGQVTSLDEFVDNGMYSGVLTDEVSVFDTFVVVVVNNYAVAAATRTPRKVTQVKISVGIDGISRHEYRVGVGDNVVWGDWVDESKRISELEKDIELVGDDLVLAQLDLDKSKRLLGNMIPSFNGIVESATVQQSSTQSYNGVYFIKSSKLFAVKGTGFNGGYYSSWPGREVYNDITAIPNRCYYNTSDKEIYYFDGTSFTKIIEQEALLRKQDDETLSQRISELESFVSSDYLEQTYAYGVEWDTGITTPECTRIGSARLHRELPVQNGMRGCLLNDNGVVVEYLPADDWTTAVRDGSRGQVMVELPKHYRKFVTDGTKRQVWLSMMPLAGYHEVPKAYVGAYEAALDRTNLKLASVANASEQYRGGDNTADWDGTYRSLLGRPVSFITCSLYRDYARKRKADSFEWNAMAYALYKELFWLCVVEFATLNSQAAYNAQPTGEGFKQGCLGNGVTTVDSTLWETYNTRNPFIPCGVSDALGNSTGEVDYIMPAEYSDNDIIIKVNRYRGIEIPFGHLGCFLDGVSSVFETPTSDYGDVYVCEDPSLFKSQSVGVDNYRFVGQVTNTKGYDWWITEIIFGEGGEIVAHNGGAGGSNKYYCDVMSMYPPAGGPSAIRAFIFGGYANSNTFGGPLNFNTNYRDINYNDRRIGTRLCFIPKK